MICLFRNCIKKATCSVNYYYYIGYVLCDHHKELLSILCEYYHNSSYEEEIKLRRMCLFLYNTNFSDYGHCERAKIRVCIYCHVIDYIDFIVGPQVNDDGVCESCVQKRKIL